MRLARLATFFAAAVAMACLLPPARIAHATERSFTPVKRERGELLFRLHGLEPAEIRAAYLHARNYRRPLRTSLVRKKAVRGLLRVRVPLLPRTLRHHRRRSADHHLRQRRLRAVKRVTLVIVTYPTRAQDAATDPKPTSSPDSAPDSAPESPQLGRNSCSGVVLTPASDLQVVIDAWPEGATFCLQAGTYYLSNSVQTHSYDHFVGQPGVIFDGQGTVESGFWGYGGTAGEPHVTVENIIFQHFTGTAVRLGWYSYVGHNEMRDNRIGVSINSYSELANNYIHNNYQYGVVGGPGRDILIEDNELSYNNTSNFCAGTCRGDAGGSKIVGSATGMYNLVWRNNYVHDNTGNGIWSDGNVRTALYEDNTVEDNSGSGIFHEISWDTVIRNNTVADNDSPEAGESCWHGAQIENNDSTNVEVYGNTVIANNGTNGICAVDIERSTPIPASVAITGLYVHNNTVYMKEGASTGLVGRLSAAEEGAENRFVDNTYYSPNTLKEYWVWPQERRTWKGWQAAGQDTTGSSHVWP
jgi:parallel beta-helix repeat protein